MSIALLIFVVSLSGMILMVTLKMTVFKAGHLNIWVSVRSSSDQMFERMFAWCKMTASNIKNKGLHKIFHMIYHDLIPFIERKYRGVVKFFVKLHRSLSHTFERSKTTTKNASEYLQKLSEDTEKEISENTPL